VNWIRDEEEEVIFDLMMPDVESKCGDQNKLRGKEKMGGVMIQC